MIIDERFMRTELLFGEGSVEWLATKKVAIFGLGGVGAYALEGIVRSGIGNIILIDNDVISISNINRQLIALSSTIGMPKTQVASLRALDINPNINITICNKFYLAKGDVSLESVDYVVDAIDTITAKIALVEQCCELNIPIISAMGCGNKVDASALKIADIYSTTDCPLCRVMRKELKTRNIKKLKVVFSNETQKNINVGTENGRHPPASGAFVPSVAGLLMGNYLINDLINLKHMTTK